MASFRQRHKNTNTARTGVSVQCPGGQYPNGTMKTKTPPADRPAGSDDSIAIPDSDQFADEWDDFLLFESPFLVFDEIGEYEQRTGHTYHRCIECEAEMMTGRAKEEGFLHYRGCPIPNNPEERATDESTLEHRESQLEVYR